MPRYDNETDILLGGSGSKTYANEQRIHRPDFYLPPGLDRYGTRVAAKNAYYQPPHDGRPGGYLFQRVELPKGLDEQPSLAQDGRPILLTPADHAWLKPNECFVASNVELRTPGGGRRLAAVFQHVWV